MTPIERLGAALRKADAAGNTEDARRIAAEIRRLQAEAAEPPSDERPAARPDAGWRTTLEAAGNIYEQAVEPHARAFDLSYQPESLGEAAWHEVVRSAPLAAGGGILAGARAGMQAAPRAVAGVRGAVDDVVEKIGTFVRRRPGAYAAGETAAAAGAGAGGETGRRVAEAAGAGETGQQAGQLVGALGGGAATAMSASGVSRAGTRAVEGVAKHLLPFTETGGRLRAAAQMQRRSGAPGAAALAARDAPEGVTPARATGDERLMAQERRILEDNPELERQVHEELAAAQARVEQGFQDALGRPPSRLERERQLIEYTAAPGAKVDAGETDEMLEQAFNSYTSAYGNVRGYTVQPSGLGGELDAAIRDPDLFAGDAQRQQVRAFLNNQLKNMQRTKLQEDGTLSSGDLLELRSVVRARSRALSHTDGADRQTREVLDNVERRLTGFIEERLPPEAVDAMRATDQQYRKFKVAEDAVFRSGEGVLKPEQVSESIRHTAASRGAYARGGDREFRQQALARQPTENILGDPDAARRMTRGLSAEEKAPIKADFADTLWRKARTANEDGSAFLSGSKLKTLLADNREVARELGLSSDEMARLEHMADELVTIQRKSPEAVADLFEDGPANVMQLGAALLGVHGSSRVSKGTGVGALVIAQFMSRAARDTLAKLTSDQAAKLMQDAVTDRQLYSALLTGPTKGVFAQREAGQRLNAWLLSLASQEAEGAFDRDVRAWQAAPSAPGVPADVPGLLGAPGGQADKIRGLLPQAP